MKVWFADDALLVVEKPAGLLSVPGKGEAGLDCLSLRVAQCWPDALVVHRLDMPTSGLMLFARGAQVQRHLSMAFAARQVTKRYAAVVHGLVRDDAGEVDAPLAVDWPNRPRQHVDRAHGKPSLTRYRVARREAPAARTRVVLEPVSGRAHQLRVHMAWIGHPIVGDALYGGSGGSSGTPAPRLLLHAEALAFAHPVHGTTVAFESPAPF